MRRGGGIEKKKKENNCTLLYSLEEERDICVLEVVNRRYGLHICFGLGLGINRNIIISPPPPPLVPPLSRRHCLHLLNIHVGLCFTFLLIYFIKISHKILSNASILDNKIKTGEQEMSTDRHPLNILRFRSNYNRPIFCTVSYK